VVLGNADPVESELIRSFEQVQPLANLPLADLGIEHLAGHRPGRAITE
jgi:hypothetical protein